MSLGGLLSFLQTGIEQPQELQHTLLSAGLCETRVIHHQVGIDLSIVPADVEATSSCVVLLNNLHPGHEP